jgi:hypothetical protein
LRPDIFDGVRCDEAYRGGVFGGGRGVGHGHHLGREGACLPGEGLHLGVALGARDVADVDCAYASRMLANGLEVDLRVLFSGVAYEDERQVGISA